MFGPIQGYLAVLGHFVGRLWNESIIEGTKVQLRKLEQRWVTRLSICADEVLANGLLMYFAWLKTRRPFVEFGVLLCVLLFDWSDCLVSTVNTMLTENQK